MFRLLDQNPARVFAVLAAYFIVEVIVRLILPHSLELDESQQIFLAQWLAVGYDSQPPFYNWIQYAVTGMLGASVFSLSLVKNSMLFLSYLFYGLAGWLLIGRKSLAMLVPLGLLTIPQVSFEAQRDLTHTVAVIFASCFFIYAIVRTIERPSLMSYVLTGLAVGIGMNAKYNFVLLPAAALVAVVIDPQMRRRLFDWRLAVTAVVALAITLPHALWFLGNIQAATDRTMGKLIRETDTSYFLRVVDGVTTLAISTIGFSIVTIVIFALAFGRNWREILRASSRWTRFFERLLALLYLFLLVVILAGGVDSIRDRYLTPYLLILPLYLCLKLDAADPEVRRGFKTFVETTAGIMIIVPIILVLRITTAGWTGQYSYLNIPIENFGNFLAADVGRPAVIVSDNLPLLGNMRVQFPQTPAVLPGYADFRPAVGPSAEHPVVVTWMQWRDRELPAFSQGLEEFVQSEYGPLRRAGLRTIALPRNYGRPGDNYAFSYTWYVPATNKSASNH